LPNLLTVGERIHGAIANHTESDYYYLTNSADNEISVVLMPMAGDVDLFINVID
jgi:hypothetical protein